MTNRIVIDGSLGEGGGQILRTALSLAALGQQAVEINNIRANRKKPGLRPQHLAAVRALAQITGAAVAGDHENSISLAFAPRKISGGNYRFSIGTAGSVTLLGAALLPPLLFAATPSRLVLEGDTHVPFSPVFQYMNEIFLPFLRRLGGEVEATLERWGWYPHGGGACTLRITPCQDLRALKLPARGRLRDLTLTLARAGLPGHISEQEAAHVRARLREQGYEPASRFLVAPSRGPGNLLFLKGRYTESLAGFSMLGEKGRPAEQVAEQLCRQWLAFEGGNGAVDHHLADQILLYMALARGDSLLITEQVTSHLRTNIEIIERFLPVRFKLDQVARSVAVRGIAHGPAGTGGCR